MSLESQVWNVIKKLKYESDSLSFHRARFILKKLKSWITSFCKVRTIILYIKLGNDSMESWQINKKLTSPI